MTEFEIYSNFIKTHLAEDEVKSLSSALNEAADEDNPLEILKIKDAEKLIKMVADAKKGLSDNSFTVKQAMDIADFINVNDNAFSFDVLGEKDKFGRLAKQLDTEETEESRKRLSKKIIFEAIALIDKYEPKFRASTFKTDIKGKKSDKEIENIISLLSTIKEKYGLVLSRRQGDTGSLSIDVKNKNKEEILSEIKKRISSGLGPNFSIYLTKDENSIRVDSKTGKADQISIKREQLSGKQDPKINNDIIAVRKKINDLKTMPRTQSNLDKLVAAKEELNTLVGKQEEEFRKPATGGIRQQIASIGSRKENIKKIFSDLNYAGEMATKALKVNPIYKDSKPIVFKNFEEVAKHYAHTYGRNYFNEFYEASLMDLSKAVATAKEKLAKAKAAGKQDAYLYLDGEDYTALLVNALRNFDAKPIPIEDVEEIILSIESSNERGLKLLGQKILGDLMKLQRQATEKDTKMNM